jgi:PAS domain S-box-containing protein
MDQQVERLQESRRVRRTLRDLVALSTLSAVWIGLGPDSVARSLADVLLHTLSLDLVFVRLPKQTSSAPIEVIRSGRGVPAADESVRASLAPFLDTRRDEPPSVIPDPSGEGMLRVAIARFGAGDDHGMVVACSRDADFPTEQDRLLLGVAANQTAVVAQRRRAEQQIHEQREWLQVTLASIGDAVITTDIDGRVTYLNRVAEALTGWTSADAKGRPLETVFQIVNEQTRGAAESPVQRVLRVGTVFGLANHTLLIARDGTELPIDDSAAPIRDSTGVMIGVVMVFRDVAEQRRMEQQRNVRLAVGQLLSQVRDVEEVIKGVLEAICQNLGWDLGLFWALDASGDYLICRSRFHCPDLAMSDFARSSGGRQFRSGEGLPGRVWASSEAMWIADLATDGRFPRLAAAAAAGLRSALACPVLVDKRPRGVFEFFTRRPWKRDSDVLETVATAAANVGQYIERNAAEQELRRSEEELAEFFENATVALHWVGPDGAILRANRAELDMLGYSREEYVGRRISEFHVDEDVICDILDKLSAGEKLVDYPARLRCKNGDVKDVLIDSSVLWKDGRFVHTRCFTRDVTEKKRAETALADARAQLDAALEAGAIATWTCDIQGNRLHAGGHLARLFNLPASAADGGRVDDYTRSIHPDDLPRVMEALDRAVQGDAEYEADYRIMQAGGALRWVTARGRTERDATGRPVRMPGVLVDITERKRLEENLQARLAELAAANRHKEQLLASLRESELKFRLLADTIPQLAWTARADGYIFWYNRRWYEYTGTTPEQVEGSGWQTLHDPAVLPEVLQRWRASIASGEPFEMIFPLKGADGGFRPFLTRVNPLRASDGHILYWFGTNTDISEIKRMEQALREADHRKDEFLAILAHELRNPLAPIRNALQILNMPRVDPATAAQARDIMERQLQAMVRLVDDLLDVARVMRGKIELRREPVELSTLIARAVETVQPLLHIKGHRLEVLISNESLVVNGDAIRLTQVISNLLTNSAKYTEENGEIRVSAARDRTDVVLRVGDSGVGIAPEVLPHIFELFVQGDHTAVKGQGGLGIGLTLVKNLVDMHGGSVEARSRGTGTGSEFTVRLPLMIGQCAGAHDLVRDEASPEPPPVRSSPARRGRQPGCRREPRHAPAPSGPRRTDCA